MSFLLSSSVSVTMTSKRSVTGYTSSHRQIPTDYICFMTCMFLFFLFWLDLIIRRPWVQIALSVSRSVCDLVFTCCWGNTFFHCLVCGFAGLEVRKCTRNELISIYMWHGNHLTTLLRSNRVIFSHLDFGDSKIKINLCSSEQPIADFLHVT